MFELFDLRGKKALVTGASSGIGRKVAQTYLEAGADVAVAARHSDVLERVAGELAAAGTGKVVPVRCDVTQPDEVTAMLDRVTAELGGVDITVCNAGIIAVEGMLDMSPDEFQRIQNTNVNGVFLTAQAAARVMVRQGRGGVIITTASMSGHIINAPQPVGHYCTSKAAVIHLTKAMAVEFAPHHIRVNSVSPGLHSHRAGRAAGRVPLPVGAQDTDGPVGPARRTHRGVPVSGQRRVQLYDRLRRRDRRWIHVLVTSAAQRITLR